MSSEPDLEAKPQAPASSRLDRLEQASKIFATALIPVIVALGGWWIQSAIETDKQKAAEVVATQQSKADEQKVSLEYVKLAKEILTSDKPLPKELTKWSWGLIDQVSPRKFSEEDLKNVIDSGVRIPPPAVSERSPVSPSVKPSSLDGFVISVLRARTERRPGSAFSRTVGYYHVFFKGQMLPGLEGMTVERQGPGNNSLAGVQSHSRLEAGVYPLFTHASASGKYQTFRYADPPSLTARPWPVIRIEETGLRQGIIIQPASGYLMSIGTVNLSAPLADASANIEFQDSAQRVIAVIQAMKEKLGTDFPTSNNQRIPNAWLSIAGEPADVAPDVAPQETDAEATPDAKP